MRPNFSYVGALSINEAAEHLSSPGARLHAGGTDLLSCLRDHVFETNKVVSISRIEILRGIRESEDGSVIIGALTTISEVASNPLIRKKYTALSQAAAEVGSPQLRNQGTIGGNICQKPRCWYYRGDFHCLRKGGDRCYAAGGENQFHCIFGGYKCHIVHPSDIASALAAFGATIRIEGKFTIRSVGMENFFILPRQDLRRETLLEQDEIVTWIKLPPPVDGLKSSYRKVRARRAWDFALAGVALAIQFTGSVVENARVVFSGVAPVPWRSMDTEKVLTGRSLDETSVSEAAEAAIQKAEPMEKNAYKIKLLRGIVEEELTAIAGK